MTEQKSRDELKFLFKNGMKPKAVDFEALIDSAINRLDDGIDAPKPATPHDTGHPLTIQAQGKDQSLLEFQQEQTPTWRINQNPLAVSGLNFESRQVEGYPSRLFIASATGYVGIGTTTPSQTLEVNGSAAIVGDIRLGTTDQATTLTVLGTGESTFAGSLTVSGDITTAGRLSATGDVTLGTAGTSSQLTVLGTGESTFAGSLTVSGGITAQADVSIAGCLTATGSGISYINGKLGIGKQSATSATSTKSAKSAQPTLDVHGSAAIDGNLIVTGQSAQIQGALSVGGNLTCDKLHITTPPPPKWRKEPVYIGLNSSKTEATIELPYTGAAFEITQESCDFWSARSEEYMAIGDTQYTCEVEYDEELSNNWIIRVHVSSYRITYDQLTKARLQVNIRPREQWYGYDQG